MEAGLSSCERRFCSQRAGPFALRAPCEEPCFVQDTQAARRSERALLYTRAVRVSAPIVRLALVCVPTLVPALLITACSEDRTPAPAGGVHPAGWTDPASPSFHAKYLASNGFPLPTCQQCHGDDFRGGSVGISCSQAGCHVQSPISCTTCHGSRGTPRPQTGAHWAHQAYCGGTCHQLPVETVAGVQHHASGDAGTILAFGGIAILDGGAAPSWDAGAQQCANVYCHGAAWGKGLSPKWNGGAQIRCDGCHDAPPADHARWSRVASSTAACASCHPDPSGSTHVDGVVEVTVTSCTACHGSDGHPNPPTSLDGSTLPSDHGVGAHVRHLDGTLPDRISEPLLCNDCHLEPTQVVQNGHPVQAQTPVRFPFGGQYDAATQSCNVWCHFNRDPGPAVWTNDTGSARQCDGCHLFPPVTTRAGDPHPSVPGELSACLRCHPFSPQTHVNGVVDFLP
jgi:predicted CxxxxCH...CXXCH cytochrome family protein